MSEEKNQSDFDISKLGQTDSQGGRVTRWLLRFLLLALVIGGVVIVRMAFRDQIGPEEIEKGLVIADYTTRWVDKESEMAGMISIVPSIQFHVRNVSDKPMSLLSFIGIFEFIEGGEQIGDGNIPQLLDPLLPGETSPLLTITSRYGYTASSKEAFVKNATEWKPVRVRLLARKNSAPGKLGTFEISKDIAGLEATTIPALVESSSLVARSVRIEDQVCKWTRKEVGGKHVIYPFARIRIRNIATDPLPDLFFRGEFIFEDGTQQINIDYPNLKAGLAADAVSDEILIRSEYGLEAEDLKAFYDNRNTWQTIKIKLYAKTAQEDFFLLGTYETVKEIEGVKLVYERP